MNNTFYITTTLPYVNADPHIGFALEIIQADAIARYQRLLGKEVIFNTGTDEHGLKIFRKAEEAGVSAQEYVDGYAKKFDKLKSLLNVSYTNFIRTTDSHHIEAAQEMWTRCNENGYIYKKQYQVKYCVGCELEKTDSDLEDGQCAIHPTYEIELIDEENYFFKFSEFENQLLELYKNNPDFVVPPHRGNEIKAFVERGLRDFSISRLKEKMPWGVPVPGDDDHVMYVWFDALTNYVSTIGWPHDEDRFNKFWPVVQTAGTDNLRQQTAIWQAMLMAAGLPTSKQVFIHGFITSEGQKMSKSTGNVVNPVEIVEKYGVDATRFYLLGALPSYDDGDFSIERFEDLYGAHLANGIGNLTSRILTMLEKYSDGKVPAEAEDLVDVAVFWETYEKHLNVFSFDRASEEINAFVSKLDGAISEQKPWEKAKNGEDISDFLYQLAESLRHLGTALLPFLPDAAEKILASLQIDAKDVTLEEAKKWGGLQKDVIIKKGDILFPRLEK
jgi:methionyl-tRNA synthetase